MEEAVEEFIDAWLLGNAKTVSSFVVTTSHYLLEYT